MGNFTKLNRSSRNAVSTALVMIAAIAVYNQIVAPHTAYLFAAQRNESALSNIVRNNETIKNTVEFKRKKLQQLLEKSAQLHNALFKPDEAKGFLNSLEAIAEEAGCAVHSLQFGTSASAIKNNQGGNIPTISTNSAMLGVTGVYDAIIKLIEKLQMRNQGVLIESITMEPFNDSSDRLKCDMTITIYVIQNKETAFDG